MQDHTSFDEEFGEFFDTGDNAMFADKTILKAVVVPDPDAAGSLCL